MSEKLLLGFDIATSIESIFDIFFKDGSDFVDVWHKANGGSSILRLTDWKHDEVAGCWDREQRFDIWVPFKGQLTCVEYHSFQRDAQISVCYSARNLIQGAVEASYRLVFNKRSEGRDCIVQCFARVTFINPVVRMVSAQIAEGAVNQYKNNFINMERLMKDRLQILTTSGPIIEHEAPREAMQSPLLEFEKRTSADMKLSALIVLQSVDFPGFLCSTSSRLGGVVGICQTAHIPCHDDNHIWLIRSTSTESNRSPFSLRSLSTGFYLGHDILGRAVASAMIRGAWERTGFEFEAASCTVLLINWDWNFGRGAYLVLDKHNKLICAPNMSTTSRAKAARFIMREVETTSPSVGNHVIPHENSFDDSPTLNRCCVDDCGKRIRATRSDVDQSKFRKNGTVLCLLVFLILSSFSAGVLSVRWELMDFNFLNKRAN